MGGKLGFFELFFLGFVGFTLIVLGITSLLLIQDEFRDDHICQQHGFEYYHYYKTEHENGIACCKGVYKDGIRKEEICQEVRGVKN